MTRVFPLNMRVTTYCIYLALIYFCDKTSGSYNSYYNEVVVKNNLKSAIANDLPIQGKFFDAMSERKL